MKNLNGLENLKTIGWAFRIEDNLSLESLKGLDNISLIGNHFEITGNSSLTEFCDLRSYLSNTSFNPYIANNGFNPSKQDIINGNCSQ